MLQPLNRPAKRHPTEALTALAERGSKILISGYGCAALIWVAASNGTIEAFGLPAWSYTLRTGLFVVTTGVLLWVLTRRLISRLELAQQSFADAEEGFTTLFDSHPTPLWLYDPTSLQLVKGNLAALRTYHYPSDDVERLPLQALYADEAGQALSGPMKRSVHELLGGSHTLRRRDGSELKVSVLSRRCAYNGGSLGLLVMREVYGSDNPEAQSAHRQQHLEQDQPLGTFGCWEFAPDQTGAGNSAGAFRQEWPNPEPLGREHYLARIAEADRINVERVHQEAMRSGWAEHEYRIIQPDGELRYVFERIQLRTNPASGVGSLCGVFIDVSRMRMAHQRLTRQRSLYQRMLNSFPEGVVVIRGERVHFANETARRLFLTDRLGKNESFAQFIHADDRAREIDRMIALQRGLIRESPLRHIRLIRGDDSELEAEVIEIRLDDSERSDVQLLIRDVSQARRMRRDLEDANGRLQALSQRLMDIRETERRQLARELHDDIGQQLTGLKLHLQRMSGQLDGNVAMQRLTVELTQTLDGLLTTVRRLSLALHPLQLETLGLEAAIRTHLSNFLEATPIKWSFKVEGNVADVPPRKALVSFRIFQEAVNNLVRHAKATSVQIKLSRRVDGLVMEIVDDGIGFDVHAARKRAQSLGLTSMQERVTSLGGELKVTSLQGVGTRITVRLPRAFSRSDGEIRLLDNEEENS